MRPPSLLLWAAELPRAVLTVAGLPFAGRLLTDAPRGDGRPVMTLPGLVNSDRSNFVLTRYLRSLSPEVTWGVQLRPRVMRAVADALARVE